MKINKAQQKLQNCYLQKMISPTSYLSGTLQLTFFEYNPHFVIGETEEWKWSDFPNVTEVTSIRAKNSTPKLVVPGVHFHAQFISLLI